MNIQKRQIWKIMILLLTTLCFSLSIKLTQAWIIEDMKIFVRNLFLIIFATIVVIIAGIVLLRKQVGEGIKIVGKKL